MNAKPTATANAPLLDSLREAASRERPPKNVGDYLDEVGIPGLATRWPEIYRQLAELSVPALDEMNDHLLAIRMNRP
jgi:hypothetical protein